MAVTYHEMRVWARWLGIFTAQEMADTLGTPIDVGEQACIALTRNDVIQPAGEIDEYGELVPVYEATPLPPGPTTRPRKTPPEILIVRQMGMLLFNERGVTQYLENDIKRRQMLSLPGQSHKMRLREKRRKKMMAAKEERQRLAASNGDLSNHKSG